MSIAQQYFWVETMPLLRLIGDGTRAFLNGQTTSDCLRAETKNFLHTCWLNISGKVRAILEIRFTDHGAEIVVLAGEMDDLCRGLEMAIFPADNVQLAPLSQVQRIQHLSLKKLGRFHNIQWILPDHPLPEASTDCKVLSPNKFERWRMEQGLPRGAGELNGVNNPFELGLADLVNSNKGCYLGQEAIAKLLKAKQVRYQLMFWESDGNLAVGQSLEKVLLETDSKKIVGSVLSSYKDSDIGSSFGLAMVRTSLSMGKSYCISEDLSKVKLVIPMGFVRPNVIN